MQKRVPLTRARGAAFFETNLQKKSIKFYHSALARSGVIGRVKVTRVLQIPHAPELPRKRPAIMSRGLRFLGLLGGGLKLCSRSQRMTAFNAELLESSV